MRKKILMMFAVGISLAAGCAIASSATMLAPVVLAISNDKVPITDNIGRVEYIVDLTDDADEGFPTVVGLLDRDRFGERPLAQAINMVKWYEEQYGFQHTEMTSWVGNSFTAFLTDAQVEALRTDPAAVVSDRNQNRFSWLALSVISSDDADSVSN